MRRRIALVVFVALAVLSIDHLLLPFVLNHAVMHRVMTSYPDRGWNGYSDFLVGVRAHTKAGDTIALIVPKMSRDSGYMYAYYRASYFLSGREVVPLLSPDGAPQPSNIRAAHYLAVWRLRLTPSAHVVWSGAGGALVER
jgi:hypothetical protein